MSKDWLDLALHGCAERWRFGNDDRGWSELAALLGSCGVARVGLEASGGYERAVVAALGAAGIETILFQPRQVRAYGTYRLRRAKTDAIDAGLIAAYTAAHGPAKPAPDPRLETLAESLRLVEQIDDDLVRLKTRQEACRDPRINARNADQIARLEAEKTGELKRLEAELRAHPDLARRLDLLVSVPGLGVRTALTLVIRMPELGDRLGTGIPSFLVLRAWPETGNNIGLMLRSALRGRVSKHAERLCVLRDARSAGSSA